MRENLLGIGEELDGVTLAMCVVSDARGLISKQVTNVPLRRERLKCIRLHQRCSLLPQVVIETTEKSFLQLQDKDSIMKPKSAQAMHSPNGNDKNYG